MSKIKFKIGTKQFVLFNLPSKAVGDPNICIGKVSIHTKCLTCSNTLKFAKKDLVALCQDVTKMHKSLKGKTSISSECNTFKLVISITNKGHVKFLVSMSNHQFSSPENNEWSTNVCFHEYLESLVSLIKCEDEIKS